MDKFIPECVQSKTENCHLTEQKQVLEALFCVEKAENVVNIYVNA